MSASATAAPIYLSCSIQQKTRVLAIELSVDENEQAITTTIVTTGYSVRTPAVFTPSKVSWRHGDFYYEVSRTDLTIVRDIRAVGYTGGLETGKCQVSEAPKRAF